MFFSLYDVNFVQLDGRTLRKVLNDLTVVLVLVEPNGIEPLTS